MLASVLDRVQDVVMLGEGLTTAAPVQQLRFDEAAFDRPPRRRVRWLVGTLAVTVAAIAVAIIV